MLCAISFNKDDKRTDGVFESAMEKIDKGLPLNEREAQRVHDILHYKENKQIEEIEKRHYRQ